VDSSAVNYLVVGTYAIVYSVIDQAGNETTVSSLVTITLETGLPVITGATNLTIELNDTTFDFLQNVSATDDFDGDLTDQVEVNTSAIVFSVPGTYSITYSVTDQAGNQTSVTVNLVVRDNVAPVITGARNLTFEVFSTPNFLWKDIRINDNIDGNLLSKIVIDSSLVNLSVLGTYPLTYSVTDTSGNTASVTVQITIADRTKPVITASSPIYYLEGEDEPVYLSLATAMDNYDGDITNLIIVNSSAVNLAVVGSYNVIYTVSDNQGNTTSLTIQLIVPNPTDVNKVNQQALELSLPEAPITNSLSLPTVGSLGTTITWVSLSPTVMTKLGNIIRPGINQADADVELLATIKSGNYQKSFTYLVTVAALDETVIASKVTLDYTALGTDYVTTDGVLDTYFVSGGSVPYVSIEEYLMLINGALESDILEFTYTGHLMTISYDIDFEDIDGNVTNQTLTAIIDFTANTMTVETFDFFSYYVASTTTDYGDGLEYVGADYVDPQPVTFTLGEYGFDLVIYNDGVKDNYLMPFHVTNLLFAGNVYFDVYYNGNEYFGLDTRQLYNRTDPNVATIRTSTLNNSSVPLDMKLASYNFLGLSMDYFYGIKKFANVDTYYDLLAPYIDTMVYSGDINFYQGIFKFIYGLDDLHSSHVFTGYYEPVSYSIPLSIQDLGTRSGGYYNRMWGVQDLYDAEFGSYTTVPFSRLTPDGKTAIIHIDGFDVETPNAFKRALDELPASVENVVVDIANNGGGNIGAVLRIFGYMTEEDIIYHSQNPADGSAATYYIQSEYVAYPYNWFVMTSSVSFSAANLMASMAKELGIPVIGQNASGGASSIGILLPPGGSSLLISTNNVLSARIINELGEYVYLSIEYGITVDHKLSNVADDEEIQALINLLTLGN
jgi:carboxyl-terminal processing protease